ncbi:MAG: acyltransferase family protein [Eubacterium sp.]
MPCEKKYYDELNIFRGLIIIWVVIGHSFDAAQPILGFAHSYAYTFHMPAFFLLSGFLFAPKIRRSNTASQKLSLVFDRFKRLIIPYLFLTLVSYILKFLFESYANNALASGWGIVSSVLLGINNPNGGLWFLHLLFILSVIAVIISRLPITVTFVIFAVLKIVSLFVNINIPIISSVFFYGIYFFFGMLLIDRYDKISEFFNKKLSEKKSFAAFSVISVIMLAASFAASFFYLKIEKNSVLSFLLCVFNIILWYFIAQLVMRIKPVKPAVMTIGFYGMDIYMIGYYIQISIRVIFGSMLGLPITVYTLLMFIFGLLLPIPISKYIVRKIKLTRILILGDFSSKNKESNNG